MLAGFKAKNDNSVSDQLCLEEWNVGAKGLLDIGHSALEMSIPDGNLQVLLLIKYNTQIYIP